MRRERERKILGQIVSHDVPQNNIIFLWYSELLKFLLF